MTIGPFRRAVVAPALVERRARLRRGRWSETIAAAFLIGKGYRILGRRVKTRAGEIDLIAVRGKRLAFVEVKRRLTRQDAEAAISSRQSARVRRGADLWLAGHPRYQNHEIGFDVVFLIPRRWPQHLPHAL